MTTPNFVPAGALFDGRELAATTGDGYLVSAAWSFIPPQPARDDLATTGQLTVTASQGELQASRTQRILPLDAGPGQQVEYAGWDGTKATPEALVIWGFNVGSRIPIGLYRATGNESEYQLIDQIGEVIIPNSGIAVFDLPPSIVADYGSSTGDYCVAGPFLGVASCFI